MENMLRNVFCTALLGLLILTQISAQSNAVVKAMNYVQSNAEQYGLSADDVRSMRATDVVPTKHNGVTHIYLTQTVNGVDVDGSSISIWVKEDRMGSTSPRMISDLSQVVQNRSAQISAQKGLLGALNHLGYERVELESSPLRKPGNVMFFDEPTLSSGKIRSHLKYVLDENQAYTLAYEYQIHSNVDGGTWSILMDATNGKFLSKESMVIHCQFEDGYLSHPHQHTSTCLETSFEAKQAKNSTQSTSVDNSKYRVVPLPIESPSHGDMVLLENPAHPVYSPFGWHSDDGDDTPDYNYTRGNNVHAFLDRDWNNNPDRNVTGGLDLTFDFPIDFDSEPETYEDAAVTNLFYLNNMIHDLAYSYGFDEAAGNFQEFNQNNEGSGGDAVNARAQRGADDPTVCGEETQQDQDGNSVPCINNANFATPGDGSNPAMNMFLWTSTAGNRFLRVDAPAPLAGLIETNGAEFGATIGDIPVSGEVVLMNDGSNNPTQGCVESPQDLSDKVALIDRGTCFFSDKVLVAQNAGAIAAIICNFEEALLGGDMGSSPEGGADMVTIPSVFITSGDCARIRTVINDGLVVSLVNTATTGGPARVDGDFDNGIVLHEFTHGISNRLTGGASNSGCLGGTESRGMGEGWSDFFSLIATVRPGDVGDLGRGIGTYAQRDLPTGRGIRPFPYSTDMTVNPHTFEDIAFVSVPHGVGSVWCAMLWDLYWKMVDEHGFSDDPIDGDMGNNMAIQLVIDGMKLQPCNPGFVEARDAILTADQLNNNGLNQCLIWEVFARRGLGFGADQVDVNNVQDSRTSFDIAPTCIKELKVVKSVTPFINPGEDIEVTVLVQNHKEEIATNVVVSDELPFGLSYVSTSSSITPTVANGQVTFEIAEMAAGEVLELNYMLSSSPTRSSIQLFYDDMEDGDGNWDFFFDELGGINIWSIFEEASTANSGENAWFVPDVDEDSDHQLRTREPITVDAPNPFIRFYHNYEMDPNARDNAGFVTISKDGGMSFERVEGKIVRGDYPGRMTYSTFAIPNLQAFWGASDGYFATYIDLSDYIGEDILVDFRFGTDDDEQNAASVVGIGWFIDDFEYMNLLSYNGEVCVTSDQGDQNCAIAPQEGTIVESALGIVGLDPLDEDDVKMQLQPNPASGFTQLVIQSKELTTAEMNVTNITGQSLISQKINLTGAVQTIPINISNMSAGIYFVNITSENKQRTMKLIVE